MRNVRSHTILVTTLAVILAACGTGGSASPGGTTLPTTVPIPRDIVLDGTPQALFGSPAGTDDVARASDVRVGEAPVSTVNPCPPDVDPMDPVCQGIPDVVVPGSDGLESEFIASVEDSSFCSVLADIETRPWPTDAFDQLRVAQIWLGELEVVVPERVEAEFHLISRFIDRAVDRGEIAVSRIEADSSLDSAAETIGRYVDARCFGL